MNDLIKKHGCYRFQIRMTPQNTLLTQSCQTLFPAQTEIIKETAGHDSRGYEQKEPQLHLNLESLIAWQPQSKITPVWQEVPEEQKLLRWLVEED